MRALDVCDGPDGQGCPRHMVGVSVQPYPTRDEDKPWLFLCVECWQQRTNKRAVKHIQKQ